MSLPRAPLPVCVLRGHQDGVNCVEFCKNYGGLVSGSLNGDVLVWDLQIRRPRVTLRAHGTSVLAVHSIGSSRMVSAARDGLMKVWDMHRADAPLLEACNGCEHFCNVDVVSCDEAENCIVASADSQQQILLWDTRTFDSAVGSLTCNPNTHQQKVVDCGMLTTIRAGQLHSSPYIFGGYEDGSIAAFDMRTRRMVDGCRLHDTHPVLSIDLHSQQRMLLSGGGDSQVLQSDLWSSAGADAALRIHSLHSASIIAPGTSSARYRSDGRVALSGHWDGSLRFFDVKKMRPLAVLRHHRESVYGVAAGRSASANVMGTPEEFLFASASKDGTIAIWNLFAPNREEMSH